MGRPHPDDAGMLAVARVRGVREQDARLGLQQALGELRAAQAEVARLEAVLHAPVATDGIHAAEYARQRTALVAVGQAVAAARRVVEAAASVAAAAQERWVAERSKLRAVEMLLEKRADERALERRRAEDKAQDDLAAQRWQRAHGRTAEDGAA